MVRSEGNMSLKNPVTPPGIDPETVRLVAQRLNQYATPGPVSMVLYWEMKALLMRRQPCVYFWGERNLLYSRAFTLFSGPHSTARKILSLLLYSVC